MKSEFKKAGTLQLTGFRRIDGELLCVRAAGADAADGGYLGTEHRWCRGPY